MREDWEGEREISVPMELYYEKKRNMRRKEGRREGREERRDGERSEVRVKSITTPLNWLLFSLHE